MFEELRNFIIGGKPSDSGSDLSFSGKELRNWLLWTFVATILSALVGMFFITVVGALGCLYFLYKLIAKAIGF